MHYEDNISSYFYIYTVLYLFTEKKNTFEVLKLIAFAPNMLVKEHEPMACFT